ncbi:catalase [Janthinobacterium agaricidamnosum]|uniref:Catalase domain protein n=1 Tax=Janthinobacterium agaricidamnosum NBRC 102515 = DSM 9628 TaxID=1349767 RepID=W0UZK4_9BURK|nr:catalase [Janthinobacterium agaricidamnosum]CDG80810.1 catalase domain protein [Janthinobacterium agaricidamnosum NBRC 102515 = DSM 9628]
MNTFKFTNAKGAVSYGRYQIVPADGAHYLTDAEAAKMAHDYLASEIGQRVARAPVKFRLMLQIAQSGDVLNDPSVAWPDSRRTVELGVLFITKLAPDNNEAQHRLLFLPNALPASIEVQDPMVNARSASYVVSFGRRQQ